MSERPLISLYNASLLSTTIYSACLCNGHTLRIPEKNNNCKIIQFYLLPILQYKFTISVPVDKSLTSPNLHDVPDKDVGAKPCGKMYLGLDNVNKQLTAVLENGDLCIWDIKDPGSAHRK